MGESCQHESFDTSRETPPGSAPPSWYTRTLESYERLFGEKPPADLWPPSEIRFGIDPCTQRVNLKRYWVVPKNALTRAVLWSTVRLAVLTSAGCSGVGRSLFVVGVAVFLTVALVVAYSKSMCGGGSDGVGGGIVGARMRAVTAGVVAGGEALRPSAGSVPHPREAPAGRLPQAGAEETSVALEAAATKELMTQGTPRVDQAKWLKRTFGR